MRLKLFLLGIVFVGTIANAQKKVWTLQECIDYALENNLSVLQSQLNNQISENQVQIAKNQKLPDLNANVGNDLLFGRSNVPVTNSSDLSTSLRTDNFQRYSMTLGVGSNITIYNGGTLNLNEKKAAIDFQSNVWATEDLKNDISLNIVNLYLNVLLNREVESIAREQLKISENQLDLNQKLYNGGAIPLSDLYQVEAQVAQDKQGLANTSIGVEQALFNMAQLLQLPDYKKFDVETIPLPEEVTLGLYDLEEIQTYAFEHQPQTKSAIKRIESAEVDIDLAKAGYKPTVSGSYNLNTNYNDFLNRRDDDAFLTQIHNNVTHNLGVNVSIPIFSRYLNDLNVEQAKIGTLLAEKNLEIEQQTLKQEVQQAYFDVNTNFQQYEAAKEAVRSAQLSFEFAEKSFRAGQITVYDFNQSANNLFATKSQLLQAKYNFIFRLKVLDFYAGKPLEL